MATLMPPDKKSPFFTFKFMMNGKMHYGSTKVRKGEREARRVMAAMEAEMRKPKTEMTEGMNKAVATLMKRTFEDATTKGFNLEAMKEALVSLGKLTGIKEPSVVEVTDAWIKTRMSDGEDHGKSESTEANNMEARRHLLLALGDKVANGPAHNLTEEIIKEALGFLRRNEGLRCSTVNLSLCRWKSMFKTGIKMGAMTVNPAAELKPFKTTDSWKRISFTNDEVRKMLAVADKDWYGMILVALYTGLRLKDCTRLLKSNEKNGVIYFMPSKTKETPNPVVVEIPLIEPLKSWFHARRGNVIFPKLINRKSMNLSASFERLVMGKAGLPLEITLPSGEVRKHNFHCLRRTGNTLLARLGVPIELRKKFYGHASDEMNTSYTDYELTDSLAAMMKLPDLTKPDPFTPLELLSFESCDPVAKAG